jgi:hypothetical protein
MPGQFPGISFKDGDVKYRQCLIKTRKNFVLIIFFKNDNFASRIEYYLHEDT